MSQMIDEIVKRSKAKSRTLLDDRLAAEAEMCKLHDGAALRGAVDAVLAQLPAGHVTLLATSSQGIGLAAATAARRREPTSWQPLQVTIGPQGGLTGSVVIVEPVDPGSGWRVMIGRVVPNATFAFAADDEDFLAA